MLKKILLLACLVPCLHQSEVRAVPTNVAGAIAAGTSLFATLWLTVGMAGYAMYISDSPYQSFKNKVAATAVYLGVPVVCFGLAAHFGHQALFGRGLFK